MNNAPAYFSDEALARLRAPDSDDLALITVETAGFAAKELEFVGVAILDERCRSDIHNGRSTEFRVEAGAHDVSVHIKRRLRIDGHPGRATVSLPVVVEPGEHCHLVVGVAKEWRLPKKARLFRLPLLVGASFVVVSGVSWLAFKWATHNPGISQPWVVFVMLALMLGARLFFLERSTNRSPGRLSPYYLARKLDVGKPSPKLNSQYVDPFE